jgi:hypothetical protein
MAQASGIPPLAYNSNKAASSERISKTAERSAGLAPGLLEVTPSKEVRRKAVTCLTLAALVSFIMLIRQLRKFFLLSIKLF